MSDHKIVISNRNGGMYKSVVAFSTTTWYDVHEVYEN